MAKKKAKFSTFGIILLLLALVGTILAVVGLFIPWFASSVKSDILGAGTTLSYKLFADGLDKADFPIALVQAFGIMAVIFAFASLVVCVLNALGVVKIGGLVKFLLALLTIVISVLALVFAFVFIGKFTGVDAGSLTKISHTVAAGGYLTGIGGLLSGVSLLLLKK